VGDTTKKTRRICVGSPLHLLAASLLTIKEIVMTITLKDVGSGFKRTAINDNFSTIETELNNTFLRKDGAQWLEADLDFNSYRGINIADGVFNADVVNVRQLNLAAGSANTGTIASQVEVQLGADAVANVFTFLGIVYVPGINNLEVYRNGQRLENSTNYTETSVSSITLTFTPNPTDRFVFRTNTVTTSTTADSTSITHVQDGITYNLSQFLNDIVTSYTIEKQDGGDAVSKVFTLASFSYLTDGRHLEVHRNGVLLDVGDDYAETSMSTITLTFTPNPTDKFRFRVLTAA